MKLRKMTRIMARFSWDRLKVNFWLTPLVMSAGAFLLARMMHWVDLQLPTAILEDGYLVLSASAAELRAFLISMATGTLGTAGIVFSLLHIPLSTVANQYGSRLLRVFLSDRTTQAVLGMYAGTFVYCVTAATSIPRGEAELTHSQVMVSVAILLMMSTTASLFVLFHHISTLLQAPNIVAAAGTELREAIFTQRWKKTSSRDRTESNETASESLAGRAGHPVRVLHSGYIQFIDLEYLLAIAREKDLTIRLLCRPGHFIKQEEVPAVVSSSGRADGRLDRQIRRAFMIGNQRSPTQDIEYAVEQLVEIAVRSMSSGNRDPFTTLNCLDHLGDSLVQFIHQGEIDSTVYDHEGRPRILLEPVHFTELLHAAFDTLRHISRDNAPVLLRILDVIDSIGQETESPAAHKELLHHVCLIQAECQKGSLIDQDQQVISLRCETLQTKLAGTSLLEAR